MDGAREIQFIELDLASKNFNEKTVTGMVQYLLSTYYAPRALYILSLIFAKSQ